MGLHEVLQGHRQDFGKRWQTNVEDAANSEMTSWSSGGAVSGSKKGARALPPLAALLHAPRLHIYKDDHASLVTFRLLMSMSKQDRQGQARSQLMLFGGSFIF